MRTRHEPFEVHDDGCQCGECEETEQASWWMVINFIVKATFFVAIFIWAAFKLAGN